MNVLTKDDFEGERAKKQRRIRISKACLSCRMAKTKCDCAKPICSSCKKKGVTECVYNSSPLNADSLHEQLSKLTSQNNAMRKQLKRAVDAGYVTVNDEMLIKQTKEEDEGTQKTGNDRELDMKDFVIVFKKKNRSVYYGMTSWRAQLEHRRHAISLSVTDIKAFRQFRKNWKSNSKTFLSLVSIPDGNMNPEALIAHLESFAPSIDTMEQILAAYFNGLWHHMFPVVNKEIFMDDFRRVFQRSDTQGNKIKISITHKVSDLARVALVLAVLRFTLVFRKRGMPANGESLFVDLDDSLAKYIENFLNGARYLTRTSFPTLQTVLIWRLTKKIDMRDGDGGDTSNGSISFGLAMEMANTLGLHMNIDEMYGCESEHYRNMAKDLWRCLLVFDAFNSADLGLPLHAATCFADFSQVDDGSIKFKTMMAIRYMCEKLNGTKVKLSYLDELIHLFKEILNNHFEPIYTTIGKLARSEYADYALIEQVMWNYLLIGLLCSVHHLRMRASPDVESKRVNFCLATKYTLLCHFAFADLLTVVENFEGSTASAYEGHQLTGIIISLARPSLIRSAVNTFLTSSVDYSTQTRDSTFYNPLFEEKMNFKVTKKELTLKIEELQKMDDSDLDDEMLQICNDTVSIGDLLLQLNRIMFGIKAKEVIDPREYDDLLFILMYGLLSSFHKKIKQDVRAKKAEHFGRKIYVDYGSLMPSIGEFDKRISLETESLLYVMQNYEGDDLGVDNAIALGTDNQFLQEYFNDGYDWGS